MPSCSPWLTTKSSRMQSHAPCSGQAASLRSPCIHSLMVGLSETFRDDKAKSVCIVCCFLYPISHKLSPFHYSLFTLSLSVHSPLSTIHCIYSILYPPCSILLKFWIPDIVRRLTIPGRQRVGHVFCRIPYPLSYLHFLFTIHHSLLIVFLPTHSPPTTIHCSSFS